MTTQQTQAALDYRYTWLLESLLYTTLLFYQRSILVPVLDNWNEAKEDFCFYEKRWTVKMAFSICFSGSSYRGSAPWAERGVPPSSFPANYTQYLSIKISLNVCASVLDLDLLCASVSKMCLMAIASLCHLSYKRFHRNTLL